MPSPPSLTQVNSPIITLSSPNKLSPSNLPTLITRFNRHHASTLLNDEIIEKIIAENDANTLRILRKGLRDNADDHDDEDEQTTQIMHLRMRSEKPGAAAAVKLRDDRRFWRRKKHSDSIVQVRNHKSRDVDNDDGDGDSTSSPLTSLKPISLRTQLLLANLAANNSHTHHHPHDVFVNAALKPSSVALSKTNSNSKTKTRCKLCTLYFESESVRGAVTYKKVLEQVGKWQALSSPSPSSSVRSSEGNCTNKATGKIIPAGVLYGECRVCVFCCQFFETTAAAVSSISTASSGSSSVYKPLLQNMATIQIPLTLSSFTSTSMAASTSNKPINIALNKPTLQSSTDNGRGANLAVSPHNHDHMNSNSKYKVGLEYGSKTKVEYEPFWEVDTLVDTTTGGNSMIKYIVLDFVTPRSPPTPSLNIDKGKNNAYWLLITNTPPSHTLASTIRMSSHSLRFTHDRTVSRIVWDLGKRGVSGRYVRVQREGVCGLEVGGVEVVCCGGECVVPIGLERVKVYRNNDNDVKLIRPATANERMNTIRLNNNNNNIQTKRPSTANNNNYYNQTSKQTYKSITNLITASENAARLAEVRKERIEYLLRGFTNIEGEGLARNYLWFCGSGGDCGSLDDDGGGGGVGLVESYNGTSISESFALNEPSLSSTRSSNITNQYPNHRLSTRIPSRTIHSNEQHTKQLTECLAGTSMTHSKLALAIQALVHAGVNGPRTRQKSTFGLWKRDTPEVTHALEENAHARARLKLLNVNMNMEMGVNVNENELNVVVDDDDDDDDVDKTSNLPSSRYTTLITSNSLSILTNTLNDIAKAKVKNTQSRQIRVTFVEYLEVVSCCFKNDLERVYAVFEFNSCETSIYDDEFCKGALSIDPLNSNLSTTSSININTLTSPQTPIGSAYNLLHHRTSKSPLAMSLSQSIKNLGSPIGTYLSSPASMRKVRPSTAPGRDRMVSRDGRSEEVFNMIKQRNDNSDESILTLPGSGSGSRSGSGSGSGLTSTFGSSTTQALQATSAQPPRIEMKRNSIMKHCALCLFDFPVDSLMFSVTIKHLHALQNKWKRNGKGKGAGRGELFSSSSSSSTSSPNPSGRENVNSIKTQTRLPLCALCAQFMDPESPSGLLIYKTKVRKGYTRFYDDAYYDRYSHFNPSGGGMKEFESDLVRNELQGKDTVIMDRLKNYNSRESFRGAFDEAEVKRRGVEVIFSASAGGGEKDRVLREMLEGDERRALRRRFTMDAKVMRGRMVERREEVKRRAGQEYEEEDEEGDW